MTDDASEGTKPGDRLLESPVEKTAETAKKDGVISETGNQLVHEKAHAIAHAGDVRPSDPSLIAAKEGETLEEFRARVAAIKENPFGLDGDLSPEDKGKRSFTGKSQYFEKAASESMRVLKSDKSADAVDLRILLAQASIGGDTVTDATNATSEAHSVERVLSTIRLGRATPAFDQDVQSALRSLPKQLKEALLPYQIYTCQIPEDFINECRNHPGVSIKQVEERNSVRGHFALTDTDNHLQGFSEWHRNPFAGRLVHISEIANVRSTVFHEAEHTLDAKLGRPSCNDPEFERRYQLGLARVRSQALTEEERAFVGIFAPPEGSEEEEFNYSKGEAMAEFGAYFHTGRMGNRQIPAQRVLALFPELAQYVNQKVQAGEW